MIEINLVPDIKQELIKAQRVRSTVITGAILVGLVSVGIVAVLAFYVFAIQTTRDIFANGAIDEKSEKLNSYKDLSETLTIQNQLTKISELNDNKKVDSRVFDLLNAIIPPAPNDIKVSDLTIDSTSNTITINGSASNSFAAFEVFKKTIDATNLKYSEDNKTESKKLASDISISNSSYGEDSSGLKVLRFTISFTYIPELFSPKLKNVSIQVTGNGNVTDSYLGLPKSIFSPRPSDLTGGQ